VIENFLELRPTNIEQISVNVAKKVDEFLREMNYCTRRLRIFTNIFLKASSVAGLITTIGKEAGKE